MDFRPKAFERGENFIELCPIVVRHRPGVIFVVTILSAPARLRTFDLKDCRKLAGLLHAVSKCRRSF